MSREVKSNWIVELRGGNGEPDFERFPNVSRQKLYRLLAKMFQQPVYHNNHKYYHIYRADDDCYEKIGAVPLESGGFDSIIAQYGKE